MMMIRVSELLNIAANDLYRVVIMDHGHLYPFSNKTWHEMDKYSRRGVNSFYIEQICIANEPKLKQTMFIELKGDNKNDQM